MPIDSYRFLDFATRQIMKAWAARLEPGVIPFTSLASAPGPGTQVELPFEWPETPAQARNASRDVAPSPIAELRLKKPWLLPNLYSGRIPRRPGGAAPVPGDSVEDTR